MSEIFIIDQLTALPGRVQELRARYDSDYMPKAVERGMRLQHVLMDPALELRAPETNRLTYIWTVDDLAGWWRQRMAGPWDPETPAMWEGISALASERTRTFHKDMRDV